MDPVFPKGPDPISNTQIPNPSKIDYSTNDEKQQNSCDSITSYFYLHFRLSAWYGVIEGEICRIKMRTKVVFLMTIFSAIAQNQDVASGKSPHLSQQH